MTKDTRIEEQSAESSHQTKCPSCGSLVLDQSLPTLDAVCRECGVVVSAIPDSEDIFDERRSEEEEIEDWKSYYAITNSTEQQVALAFETLESIGDGVGAPIELRQRAAEIYAAAAIETLTDGHPSGLVIAACLAVAGREEKSPISTGRLANAAGSDPGTLRRMRRTVERECGLDSPPCEPEAYLEGLSRTLNLKAKTEAAARQIISTMPSGAILGKNPSGFAAAALYLVSDGAITQREVAAAAAVTTETIRMRVKDCREFCELGADECVGETS